MDKNGEMYVEGAFKVLLKQFHTKCTLKNVLVQDSVFFTQSWAQRIKNVPVLEILNPKSKVIIPISGVNFTSI